MPLLTAYSPNYFSLDDILATQERTPCKFLVNVPKMGVLNPSSEDKDLRAGTELELPIWLVMEMAAALPNQNPIVQPDIPTIYKESYREILKADATAVDLQKFNLNFYELGSYIKGFDSRGHIQDILIHTFKTRFRLVLDLADNTVSDPMAHNKLDLLERRLFKDGHDARAKLNAWLFETTTEIEAANMVVNHKKRKRIEIDELLK